MTSTPLVLLAALLLGLLTFPCDVRSHALPHRFGLRARDTGVSLSQQLKRTAPDPQLLHADHPAPRQIPSRPSFESRRALDDEVTDTTTEKDDLFDDPFPTSEELLPSTNPDSDFNIPAPSTEFFPSADTNHFEGVDGRQDDQLVVLPVLEEPAGVGPKPPTVSAPDAPPGPPTVTDMQPNPSNTPTPSPFLVTAIPPPQESIVPSTQVQTPDAVYSPSVVILPPATPTGVQDPIVDRTPSPLPSVDDDDPTVPTVSEPTATPPVAILPPGTETTPSPPASVDDAVGPEPIPTAIIVVETTPTIPASPSSTSASIPQPPTVQEPDPIESPPLVLEPSPAPTAEVTPTPPVEVTPPPLPVVETPAIPPAPTPPVMSEDGEICLNFGKGTVPTFGVPDEQAFTGQVRQFSVPQSDFPDLAPQYLSHTYGDAWTYSIAAETGLYQVILGFAEVFDPACKSSNDAFRLFSVSVPGQSVTVDIIASVGCGTPLETSFENLIPNNGLITLTFQSITQQAILSSLCYRQTSPTVPPTLASPSASPSPAEPLPTIGPTPDQAVGGPESQLPPETPSPLTPPPGTTPPPASFEEIPAGPTTGYKCVNFGPDVGNGYFPFDPSAVGGKLKVYEGVKFGDFPTLPSAYRFHGFGEVWNYTLDVSTSEPQTVALGFAEIFPEACSSDPNSGFRVFSVTVAGITQVVDVFQAAGCGVIHQISFENVIPKDGVVAISFFAVSEKSMISVICHADTRTTKSAIEGSEPIVSSTATTVTKNTFENIGALSQDSMVSGIDNGLKGDGSCFQFSPKNIPGYTSALLDSDPDPPVKLYTGPSLPIKGTPLNKVYSSHIYGTGFMLTFNTVANFSRSFVLGFAEVYKPACKNNFRVFTVHAGSTVQSVDIHKQVGCQTLLELTLENVPPSEDGSINIIFSATKNAAMLSSVCVFDAIGEDESAHSPGMTTMSISPIPPPGMISDPENGNLNGAPEAVIKPLKPIIAEETPSTPGVEPNQVHDEVDDDGVLPSPTPVSVSAVEPTYTPEATGSEDPDETSGTEEVEETVYVGDPLQTKIPDPSGSPLPKENGVIISLPESPSPSHAAIHGDGDDSTLLDVLGVSPEPSVGAVPDAQGTDGSDPLLDETHDSLMPTLTPVVTAVLPQPANPTAIIPVSTATPSNLVPEGNIEVLSTYEPVASPQTSAGVMPLFEEELEASDLSPSPAEIASSEGESVGSSPTAILPADSGSLSESPVFPSSNVDEVPIVTAVPPGEDDPDPSSTGGGGPTSDKDSMPVVSLNPDPEEPTAKAPGDTEVVVTVVISGDQTTVDTSVTEEAGDSPGIPVVTAPAVAIMPSPDTSPQQTASSDVTLSMTNAPEMEEDTEEDSDGNSDDTSADTVETPIISVPVVSPTITPDVPAASVVPVPDSPGSPDLELQDVPTTTPASGGTEPVTPGGVVIGSPSPGVGDSAPTIPIVEPTASQSPTPVVSSVTGATDVIVINPSPVSSVTEQPSPVPIAPPGEVVDVPDSDTDIIEVPQTGEPVPDGGVIVDIPDGSDAGDVNGAGVGDTVDAGSNLSVSTKSNNRGFSIGMGILGALLVLLLLICLFFAIFRSGGGTYTYSSQYSAHRPTEYDGSSQAPYTDELLPETAGQFDYGNGRNTGSGGGTLDGRTRSNSFGYGSQGGGPGQEPVAYEGNTDPGQYAVRDSVNETAEHRYTHSNAPTTGDYTFNETYAEPVAEGFAHGVRNSGYEEYNDTDQRGGSGTLASGRMTSFNEYHPPGRPAFRESGLGGIHERRAPGYQLTPPESPTVFSDPHEQQKRNIHGQGIHHQGYSNIDANHVPSGVQSTEPSFAPSTHDEAVSERPGTELSESYVYEGDVTNSVLQPTSEIEKARDRRGVQSQVSNDGPWPQWWGRNQSDVIDQHIVENGNTGELVHNHVEQDLGDSEAKENAPYINSDDYGTSDRPSSGYKYVDEQHHYGNGNEAVTLEDRNLPMTLSNVDSHWIRSSRDFNGEHVQFEGSTGDDFEELRRRREPYVKSVASRISMRGPIDSTNSETFLEVRKDLARELAEEAVASWQARAIDV